MTALEVVSKTRHRPDEDLAAIVACMRRALTNCNRFRGSSRLMEIAQDYDSIDLQELCAKEDQRYGS